MGAHVRTSKTRRIPSPPERRRTGGIATVIPQHERVFYLTRLGEALADVEGVVTAFAVIGGYAVLNVIPLGIPGRAVTIGCRYNRDGAWWFYDVRTGRPFRQTKQINAAACVIQVAMKEAATA
jgi:hypothetical protein